MASEIDAKIERLARLHHLYPSEARALVPLQNTKSPYLPKILRARDRIRRQAIERFGTDNIIKIRQTIKQWYRSKDWLRADGHIDPYKMLRHFRDQFIGSPSGEEYERLRKMKRREASKSKAKLRQSLK